MRVPAERTSVIYPAVDYAFWRPGRHEPRPLRKELGLGDDTFLYLYFGRPGVSKGVEYLVDAASLIRQRLPNGRLVLLLGREPRAQYHRIRQRIVTLGLRERVAVFDPVSQVKLPSYLLAADLVVVPSISEGFGYAAVEAASLGCRVVATSGHAVEEVLVGHVTMAPPGDGRALADVILAVARDRPELPRPPERFTLDVHIAAARELYERLGRS
jgi:glycosyltransferase involved in cell wall biosynthesis